jgi:hypothetical protein
MDEKEKIEKEIERLEAKLSKDHFGGLMDKGGRRKDENRLIKLRKELEKLSKKKK